MQNFQAIFWALIIIFSVKLCGSNACYSFNFLHHSLSLASSSVFLCVLKSSRESEYFFIVVGKLVLNNVCTYLRKIYMNKIIKKEWRDPRWWLEGGSRQHELCKSKMLLRLWSQHLAEKNHQEEAKLWYPEPPSHTKLLHTMLHWKKQEGSHDARCWLQTCLRDADQQVSK
jgi:hypothetical protein